MVFQNVELPSKFFGFGSSMGPQHRTVISEQRDGYETRGQNWAQPRRHYDVSNDVVSDVDMRELQDFVIARKGSLNSFVITDPMDFTTNANHVGPHALGDVRVGTGDGVTTVFNAMKRYADGGLDQYEYERRLHKTSEMLVGLDGVLQADPADYAADFSLGTINFVTAPTRGQAITIGSKFLVVVRFKQSVDDSLQNSFDDFNAGSISCPMIEEKNPTKAFDRKQYDPGRAHLITSGAVQIEFSRGYKHILIPTSTLEVRLPDIGVNSGEPSHQSSTITLEGGPYFFVFNLGSANAILKELSASGAGWANIEDNPLIPPGTGRKLWVDFAQKWRVF